MNKKSVSKVIKEIFNRFGLVLIILFMWEAVCRFDLVSPIILSPFTEVVKVGWYEFDRYIPHLKVTTLEICLSLLIAWGFGLLAGITFGGVRFLRDTFTPIFSSLYAVPVVIIYPVISAWFGLGIESKYIFGGIYGFFPVMLNTIAGIKGIDSRYLTLSKSIGASKFQTIIKIMLPFSLPEILAGIRLGAALAVIGVVVAEMLASSVGIGYLIETDRTIFKTSNVYFSILLVLVIVGVLDRILSTFEQKLVYWHT